MSPLLAGVATIGTRPNRALRAILAAALAVTIGTTLLGFLRTYPIGVDLEIPLRAAERWLAGESPYLGSSFGVSFGAGQPFLYPPFVLLVLAPFATLPHAIPFVGWAAVCVVAAGWTCRRLGLPVWAWPFALAWAPFAQALLGLNVQVVLFAAFVALLLAQPLRPLAPRDRDLVRTRRPPVVDGVLAVGVMALKTSQVQPLVHLLRRRPVAALAGVAVVAVAVLVTVPLTGLGLWQDWLAQVRHATAAANVEGISLLRLVPIPVAGLIVAASIALAFALPTERAAAWIGLLTLVASPSLHYFGLLFALPALLAVRREIGLVAALAIAGYTVAGAWIGVGLVGVALLSSVRWPALLEAPESEAVASAS